MHQLFSQIKQAQNGNNESMEILIQQFRPLLKKASHQLNYNEDTFSELQLFLFLLFKNINLHKMKSSCDSVIATYIKKAVYHQAEYLVRKFAKDNICSNYEDLSDLEKKRCEVKNSEVETYESLLIEDLQKFLTKREQMVIIKLYFDMFTVAETAEQLNLSRQAVNDIKNRSLSKLLNAFKQ